MSASADQFKIVPGRFDSALQCEEMVAYYRGEEVTGEIVRKAHPLLSDQPLPIPIPADHYLVIECLDGEVTSTLSLATLKRSFHLINDFSDTFSNCRMTIPYTKKQVSSAINYEDVESDSFFNYSQRLSLAESLDCLLYLGPRRPLLLLQLRASGLTLDQLMRIDVLLREEDRVIMRGMFELELGIIPFHSPIASWIPYLILNHRPDLIEEIIPNYPSFCLMMYASMEDRVWYPRIIQMFTSSTFEDNDVLLREKDLEELVVQVATQMLTVPYPTDFTRDFVVTMLTRLGVVSSVLDNFDRRAYLPYQVQRQLPISTLQTILEKYQTLFTEAERERVVEEYRLTTKT